MKGGGSRAKGAGNAGVNDLNDKNQRGNRGADDGDDFSEAGEFFLNRNGFLLVFGQFPGDFAEFRGVAGGGDNHFSVARGNEAAGVNAVAPFGQCGFLVFKQQSGIFFDGGAFAGQSRFVNGESVAFKEPSVGGNFVSRFEHDNVAGNQFALVDQRRFSAADNTDFEVIFHLVQRFKRFSAAAFHNQRNTDRKGNGDEDAGALDELRMFADDRAEDVDAEGDEKRNQQQNHHRFGERR